MNRKLYRKIAKKHGVSVEEVKCDMQIAVDAAYKEPNFYARTVCSENDKPTVDEVVDHLTRRAKTKIKP